VDFAVLYDLLISVLVVLCMPVALLALWRLWWYLWYLGSACGSY
jgi:hypothetical protein